MTNLVVSSTIACYCPDSLLLRLDEDEDEEGEGEGSRLPSGPKEGRNSQLTVGYKGDRSYVLRGDKIGVFRHKPDEVEYVASIANITDMKGKKFDPKNVRFPLHILPSPV